MEIDYTKISLEELDRIYFIHCETFAFICDGDRKKVNIEQDVTAKIKLTVFAHFN